MADVQIDNGNFTQIANVLLEKLSSAKLNGCQYSIVLIVWRYTYGFKRKEHDLSAGFLAKATGYNARQIQRDLIVLVDRKIVFQKVVNGISRILSFNKDYETWVTYGELADGEKAIGELTDGELAPPPTANKPEVTYGELAVQEINSFKPNSKETYSTIFNHWNSKKIKIHREIPDKLKGKINARLENYSLGEIINAIDNYDTVLKSELHYYTYEFKLDRFLDPMVLDDFVDKNNPLIKYLIKKQKGFVKIDYEIEQRNDEIAFNQHMANGGTRDDFRPTANSGR